MEIMSEKEFMDFLDKNEIPYLDDIKDCSFYNKYKTTFLENIGCDSDLEHLTINNFAIKERKKISKFIDIYIPMNDEEKSIIDLHKKMREEYINSKIEELYQYIHKKTLKKGFVHGGRIYYAAVFPYEYKDIIGFEEAYAILIKAGRVKQVKGKYCFKLYTF